MARKHSFRFGFPIIVAGRPSVGGVGLGCQPIRFAAAARFGALGSVLPDSDLSDSKSPQRIFRRGLNSCDDEDMPGDLPDLSKCFCGIAQKAGPRHFAWGRFGYFRREVGAIAFKQLVGRNRAAYCAAMQRWVDDASPIHPN